MSVNSQTDQLLLAMEGDADSQDIYEECTELNGSIFESLNLDDSGVADKDQRTKEFLQKLDAIQQQQSPDGNTTSIPWATAVKFLMARKFDVKRAIDVFLSHQSVRQKEGISTIDPWDEDIRAELFSQKFTVLAGRDANGAALALFTAKLHFPAITTHQAVLRALVFQLDAALESVETQKCGLVFVYDMTHSKYTNFDYELSIKILNMLKGSYPARLKKVLIVTAPLWFKAPFKILRLFVREKLRDRVFTTNILQLPSHIPITSLPQHFGGKSEHSHADWIRHCLQCAWGKTLRDCDNEIETYMTTFYTQLQPELSRGSLASVSTTMSANSSTLLTNSDIDSEASSVKGSLREDGPRIENDMDMSDDGTLSEATTPSPSSPTSPALCSPHSLLGKRSTAVPNLQPPALPSKKRPHSEEQDTVDEPVLVSIHGADSVGFTIKELMDYCRIKGRKGLYRQYAQIKQEPPAGSFEVSKAKHNLPKNRYTDVLCFDHTRVRLDPGPDYINANYLDGYKHPRSYISTQGPLPKTFVDFWKMIWQQTVLLVVMTTRTVERGRLKCGQYWPLEESDSEQYGDQFVVINNGVESHDNYNVSSLILQNLKTDETREITHFQFTSWPDYGVPHSAQAFLDFMSHVRQVRRTRALEVTQSGKWKGHPAGPPIVIHCSAGIGRTGTFTTMDICTQRLADIGTVDVQKTVRRIRSQRAFSIQMPDQYVFSHLALIEHAQREGLLTEVNLEGFNESSSDDE